MLNLSLSGCGFLGIYHIGVISAFKEHAPEFLEKISGCSAGALVAACAICDCCLGQMVSDVLEIGLKARAHALGPLHPSFSIVDILRNGLRRILPIDAHRICTGRVHISLTRWKDGKNFLVNQFDSREDLIQALICSSFIPCYSGFIPPKFKGTYYWDGGLSNNNPILDENTLIVSPFGGEADICPRDETASFYCYDFQGTNVQLSQENIYRISKALFPPNPEILKAMCFRGYKDAVNFLKARNLLMCSCNRIREKTSISSVFGEDLTAGYTMFNNANELMDDQQSDSMYDSDEDNISQFAQSVQPLNYQEMPTQVCEILDAACDDNKGLLNYVYDSQLSRAISIMFLPWTLPFEFSFNFTKRVLELIPKFKVANTDQSKNLVDMLFVYINFLIHKFTYDKYQYHSRVACKHCLPRTRSRSGSQSMTSIQFNVCNHHGSKSSLSRMMEPNDENGKQAGMANNCMDKTMENNSMKKHFVSSQSFRTKASSNFLNVPKMCPRHRVPSVCSSEMGTASDQYMYRKSKRTRSYLSTSEVASSVDLNEFKLSRSYYSKRKRSTASVRSERLPVINSTSKKSLNLLNQTNTKFSTTTTTENNNTDKCLIVPPLSHTPYTTSNAISISNASLPASNFQKSFTKRETPVRVHFHLTNSDDEDSISNNDIVDSFTNKNSQKCDDNEYDALIIDKLSISNDEIYTGDKLFKPTTNALAEDDYMKNEEEKIEYDDNNLNNNSTFFINNLKNFSLETDVLHSKNNSQANMVFNLEENENHQRLAEPDIIPKVEHLAATSPGTDSTNDNLNGLDADVVVENKAQTKNIEWDNYWDNLEFNALGKLNI